MLRLSEGLLLLVAIVVTGRLRAEDGEQGGCGGGVKNETLWEGEEGKVGRCGEREKKRLGGQGLRSCGEVEISV